MFSWRCFPFVDSTPRAYWLKASNAAPLISTSVGTFPANVYAGIIGIGLCGFVLDQALLTLRRHIIYSNR
jgi:hypothetical protein